MAPFRDVAAWATRRTVSDKPLNCWSPRWQSTTVYWRTRNIRWRVRHPAMLPNCSETQAYPNSQRDYIHSIMRQSRRNFRLSVVMRLYFTKMSSIR